MDLDLRKLRYFMALAEYLNYGRAAEALHIAQPVLSRQIRALESELHVQLFVRDKRRVELTPAGRQLLCDAPPLLTGAKALQRRANIAARGEEIFTVGFMPGLIVTSAVRALASEHPALSVDVVRSGWEDQTEIVRNGRVDVSYVRQPVNSRGLRVLDLFAEARVAVLPGDHRLAGKGPVSIKDLAAEHLLQHPDAVPEWRDIAAEMQENHPRKKRDNAYTVEEKLEHVACNRGIAILPESAALFYRRPDLAYLHIHDIGPNHVGLAWDASRRSPLISEFADIAAKYPPFPGDASAPGEDGSDGVSRR
ncbi:LysR family transcriptional regulator [Streptomyces sulfonofaciens]|uniref:LysR family transcriptional regulator n=1 Tax=Streptomyces sulfonofaciens TaxID=68272 RepID=A0A919G8J7_9ACTN|nr:LysR substrate-binding domain-containing protein [Streptomyces sulfonofaciens]GHH79245.1 LysR family transcriptional regulator [Streptomyces sulfonofaciens]